VFNKACYFDSTSKFKGVAWHKKDQVWHAQIRVDTKMHYLGSYETEEIAAAAYNNYAQIYFGEYAVLNDVDVVDFRKLRMVGVLETFRFMQLKSGNSSKLIANAM